jgi:hypothetical protein
LAWMTMPSAGTRSPLASRTMSPGTMSSTGISDQTLVSTGAGLPCEILCAYLLSYVAIPSSHADLIGYAADEPQWSREWIACPRNPLPALRDRMT